MKAVLDTNVLVSALMRDGFTRTLLLHPDLSLVTPEYALEEVQRHLPGIAERMGSSVPQARLTVEMLLEHVQTVPAAEYREFEQRAEELLAAVDPDDAHFAALAMATAEARLTRVQNCDGNQLTYDVEHREVLRVLFQASLAHACPPLDMQVLGDLARVARLPGSINGKTGLVATPLDTLAGIMDFNPFTDANPHPAADEVELIAPAGASTDPLWTGLAPDVGGLVQAPSSVAVPLLALGRSTLAIQ